MTALGFGLAFVIGISLGLLGGGGSILTVPVLVYVLHYPMKEAVPLSLVVVGVTSAFGVGHHHRAGNVEWPATLAFGPAALAGAFAGGRLSVLVSSRFQLTIFAVLMIAASASMFFGPRLPVEGAAAPRRRRAWPLLMFLGGLVGVLTGLVGVGGGFLYVPALVLLGGVAMKHAVGTSLTLIVMSCVAGFASYLGRVVIDWRAAALFTALAVIGVLVGSRLVRRVSAAELRRAFSILLLVMGVLVLLKPR